MKWFIELFSFMLLSTSVFASDLPPQLLRDRGSKSVEVGRTFSTHSPIGTGLPYSISCRAKFVDPFFGYLDDEQFFSKKLPFNLVCYAETDSIVGGGAISRDLASGKWVRDVGKWINYGGVDSFSSKEIRQQESAIRFYPLDNVNSEGYAYTIDDTIGDEISRRRVIRYCLIHPPKALCGQGEVGYLKDGRKGDLTGYALKILRSIEFLPDEPPAPETVSPDAPKTASLQTTVKIMTQDMETD